MVAIPLEAVNAAENLKVAAEAAAVKIISAFDIHFPLPYRICVTILAGIWAWGFMAKLLNSVKIDVSLLIRHSFPKHGAAGLSSARSLHRDIFHFASILSLFVFGSWVLFALILLRQYSNNDFDIMQGGNTRVRTIDLVPVSTLFLFLASFFIPGRGFHSAGRRQFLAIMRRISVGGLDAEGRFADVLVSDVLTSYTRVLLDLGVAVCMFVAGTSCVGKPDRSSCSGPYVTTIVLSIPYVIRFRQCTIDFQRTGQTMHIANCLKYLSSLPVVFFGVLQKMYKGVEGDNGFTEAMAYKLWIFAAVINSCYSIVWDIKCDWNLELLNSSPLAYKHGGLRGVLFFRPRIVYYFVILLDISFRLLWALKVTTNFRFIGDTESGLFGLELLEILRRSMWMCLRTEKEWITTHGAGNLPVVEMETFGHSS